jgi:predicted small lipoprotein YifL
VRRAAAAIALAALAACGQKGHATVDGVLIPQADGVSDVPDGATLAVDVAAIDAAVVPAGAEVVKLAVGRKVPWNEVQALDAKVRAAGARPVYLAGVFHKVRAFALEDAWPGGPRSITVTSYVDGKACVLPPGAIEARCVQSGGKNQIDRAFLRELIREQVKLFDVKQIEVELAATLPFDDVVRTIDAARTCCFEIETTVRFKPPSTASTELVPE